MRAGLDSRVCEGLAAPLDGDTTYFPRPLERRGMSYIYEGRPAWVCLTASGAHPGRACG
jgi:hypothetical protein